MNDPEPVAAPAIKRFFANNAAWMISAVVCLLFVIIIGSIFWGAPRDWSKTLLHELSDTTVARGLITFLIAVATVGIAITLTIYVVATDDANAKDKFSLGKEVLTALIGVLGTIVGFYFGASQGSGHGSINKPTTPTISEIRVTPERPTLGSTFTISAKISDGTPPYHYTITFSQDVIKQIQGDSTDGEVSKDIPLPANADPAKPLDVVIEATDKDLRTATTKAQPAHILFTRQ